jgi:hypothetical protein
VGLTTGRPLMYVQRQLGHAQITTTERLYGHLAHEGDATPLMKACSALALLRVHTTFRQIGIATSIAALGTIFASRMRGIHPGPGTPRASRPGRTSCCSSPGCSPWWRGCCRGLIRQRDFVAHGPSAPHGSSSEASRRWQVGRPPAGGSRRKRRLKW